MSDQKPLAETESSVVPKGNDISRISFGEDKRKEFWINQKGYELWSLTPEALQNPSVRRFIGFAIDAETLWGSFYVEKDKYDEGKLFEFNTYEEMLKEGYVQPPSQEFGPSVGLRLGQAENLATAVEAILEEGGLKYIRRMEDLVSHKLEHALAPLGLEVTTTHSPVDDTDKDISKYRTGIWKPDNTTDDDERKFIPGSGVTYGHYTESKEFVNPDLRKTPKDMARFNQAASDLGIPEDQRNNDMIIGFANTIVEARGLLQKLKDGLAQPSSPGLFPSDHERIYSAIKVVSVMLTILETGFAGRQIDQDLIARELNDGLTKITELLLLENPEPEIC